MTSVQMNASLEAAKGAKDCNSSAAGFRAALKNCFSQKFTLFNLLAVFLCFIIIPGLIVYKGLDAVVEAVADERLQKQRALLEANLDRLEFFSANDQFAHFLLSRLCRDTGGSSLGLSGLEGRIAKLKARFPNAFIFITADQNGAVIGNLSDLSGFSYLFRQAFQLIADLERAFSANAGLEKVLDLDARLKRLRPLLGQLINPDDLFRPLRSPGTGKSIQASGGFDKFHLWYGSGKDFRVICFVNRSFIRGKAGLEWATAMLNRQDSATITGFAPYPPEENQLVPALSEAQASEVIMALARHEELGFTDVSKKIRVPVAGRFLNHHLRGFSMFRDARLSDPAEIKVQSLFRVLRFLPVFALACFVFSLRRRFSLTVKLKVSVFFAYAVCLPLLVISSLTMQYVRQSEAGLLNNLKSELQRAIEKTDSDYHWFQSSLATKATDFLKTNLEKRPHILHDQGLLRQFSDGLKQATGNHEVMVIDAGGKDYLQSISSRVSLNRGIMVNSCRDALKIIIEDKVSGTRDRYPLLALHLAMDLHTKQNRISYLGVGDFEIGAYYRLLVPPGADISQGMVCVMIWELGSLHRRYVIESCSKEKSGAGNIQFAVLSGEEDRFVVAPEFADDSLLRLMKLSVNRHSSLGSILSLGGQDYLVVAMPGRNLKRLILGAMMPADLVKKHAGQIVLRAWAFAGLLLAIAVAGVYLLRSWFFRPLSSIREGIEAIGARK
ncbi:MAG: hypothetical protein PHD82_04320, partial [Candidatus Riflebacteria bacterium]|nr:hypothetical protein [Candidatus Riflebacteria bacterium]